MYSNDKAEYYFGPDYSPKDLPDDYNYFWANNDNEPQKPLPAKNNPLLVNGVTPNDVLNFMQNNLNTKPRPDPICNYQNSPAREPVKGPQGQQQQMANEFINQQLFKNLMKNDPQIKPQQHRNPQQQNPQIQQK